MPVLVEMGSLRPFFAFTKNFKPLCFSKLFREKILERQYTCLKNQEISEKFPDFEKTSGTERVKDLIG